jgi:hypothetical protein
LVFRWVLVVDFLFVDVNSVSVCPTGFNSFSVLVSNVISFGFSLIDGISIDLIIGISSIIDDFVSAVHTDDGFLIVSSERIFDGSSEVFICSDDSFDFLLFVFVVVVVRLIRFFLFSILRYLYSIVMMYLMYY